MSRGASRADPIDTPSTVSWRSPGASTRSQPAGAPFASRGGGAGGGSAGTLGTRAGSAPDVRLNDAGVPPRPIVATPLDSPGTARLVVFGAFDAGVFPAAAAAAVVRTKAAAPAPG